jgi:outer membrane lipoprotein-sorting protein
MKVGNFFLLTQTIKTCQKLIVLVVFCVGFSISAFSLNLTQKDLDDLGRVENYLNSIHTLKSNFIQTASTGERATGVLFLNRPGRIRVQYDPPSPILLVANGAFIIYVDNNLEQISHIPIAETPLRALIDKDVNLLSWYSIKNIKRGPGTLRVTLAKKNGIGSSSVRLLFSDKPFQLRQWVIRDQQGIDVRISLLDMKRGMKFNPNIFEVDPNQFLFLQDVK